MSNSVSAKILRKKVDDGSFGVKRYSFMVAYQGENKWISAFADPKKISPEVIDLLRELGEGDRAEFALMENKGKDGKIYHNIIGVVREKDVNDDVAPVQSDGQMHPHPQVPGLVSPIKMGVAKSGESDTRVRSMALAYAKDLIVAGGIGEGAGYTFDEGKDKSVEIAKRFEQYILTGE